MLQEIHDADVWIGQQLAELERTNKCNPYTIMRIIDLLRGVVYTSKKTGHGHICLLAIHLSLLTDKVEDRYTQTFKVALAINLCKAQQTIGEIEYLYKKDLAGKKEVK